MCVCVDVRNMHDALQQLSTYDCDNISQMFQLFDENKDGIISVPELRAAFSTRSHFTDRGDSFLKEVMDEVDKNKDNLISFEEFNDSLTSLLHSSVYRA